MSNRLSSDVMMVQRAVFEEGLPDDTDFNTLLLNNAEPRRNPHIVLEDETSAHLVDIAKIAIDHSQVFEKLPIFLAEKPDIFAATTIWVVGDFDEMDGYDLLQSAAQAHRDVPGVSIILVNNPELVSQRPAFSTLLHQLHQRGHMKSTEQLLELLEEAPPSRSHIEFPTISLLTQINSYPDLKSSGWYFNEYIEAGEFWRSTQQMLTVTGFKPGQRGLIVNGRVSYETCQLYNSDS